MHDLIIRGGTVADGTGSALLEADVAIADGRIVEVGSVSGKGREEIDGRGLLVTPGFVDIHTHYDGQVTWDSSLAPSSSHGVTTVVTGNCGVGFAPCRPEDREELINLMAGVEDIPELVMAEGLPWDWESFADYLDAVERRPHDVDIAALLPHSPLRVYVMGQRAVDREPATEEDIAKMAALTADALAAGALGFATSRALQQRSAKGDPIPTVRAAEAELAGILAALKARDSGVFQLLSDFGRYQGIDAEWAMLRRLVERSGRPMSFTFHQQHKQPDGWRDMLGLIEQAASDGLTIKGQVLGRPTGLLLGFELSTSPFDGCPTYAGLGSLPFGDKMAELRRPDVRARILEEMTSVRPGPWDLRFELSDPPVYEPNPNTSLAARAAREGTTPEALAYDVLLQDGGRRLLLHPVQDYADGSLQPSYEMLTSGHTIVGLGDGGAHCGLVCDASYTTTMLAYWTRDRSRGPRLDVANAVRALSSSTASFVGLRDRGCIAVGYKADVNVIDYDNLQAGFPHVVHDLPAGGKRVVQDATGYVATVVSGTVTRRDGRPTGALPGRLVRGPQRVRTT